MSNVPLPEPLGFYFPPRAYLDTPSTEMVGLFSDDQMHTFAAAVSASKDAEIAQLRADLIKSLADNKALCERVRVLEDALIRLCSAVKSRGLVSTVKALAQADKALDARAALEQKP